MGTWAREWGHSAVDGNSSALLFSSESYFLVNPKDSMCGCPVQLRGSSSTVRLFLCLEKKISFSLFSFVGALWSDNVEFPLKLEKGEGN